MTDVSQSMHKLKELLLDDADERLEQVSDGVERLGARLDRIESVTGARLEALFERAGTRDRFRASVADVIDKALTDAEVDRHAELSRAVSPLVIKTIKTELRNSQDEMVEALYPITGRLVQAYVANAMKELTERINRQLTQNAVSLRLKSLATGRPVSELAMAGTQRFELEEIYLIRRGSGVLLARWPERRDGRDSNIDHHISGVLTAITDFADATFPDDGGDIQGFKADGFHFLMRASPSHLLAARCRGVAPPGTERIFDEAFLETLSMPQFSGHARAIDTDHDTADISLAPLADRASERIEARYDELDQSSGFGLLKALLFIIAVPILAWLVWIGWGRLETARVENLAQSVISATPAVSGYPLALSVDDRGRRVFIEGLVPDRQTRDDLLRRLDAALPDKAKLTTNVTPIPEADAPPSVEPQIVALRRQLASLRSDLAQQSLARVIERARARLAQVGDDITAIGAATQPAGNSDRLDTARQGLDEVQAEIARLSSQLTDGDAGPGDLTRITAALNALSADVADLTGLLPTLVPGLQAPPRVASSGHSRTPSRDPLVAAEDFSATIERLATTSSSLVSVARLERPQPVVRIQQPTESADDRLERFVRRNAIFFANGTVFRRPETAEAKLDRLAELVQASSLVVRIVGYTDERGGLPRNNTLAEERARAVREALVDRGVPARQLIFVGRAAARDLTPEVGPTSPNRRVEFEIAFKDERVGVPGVE